MMACSFCTSVIVFVETAWITFGNFVNAASMTKPMGDQDE